MSARSRLPSRVAILTSRSRDTEKGPRWSIRLILFPHPRGLRVPRLGRGHETGDSFHDLPRLLNVRPMPAGCDLRKGGTGETRHDQIVEKWPGNDRIAVGDDDLDRSFYPGRPGPLRVPAAPGVERCRDLGGREVHARIE